MAIEYLIPIFLIVLLSFNQVFFSYKTQTWLYWLVVIVMISLAGFRDKVGPDWPGYYGAYQLSKVIQSFNPAVITDATGMETGYTLLNFIFAKLGFSINLFFLFFAGVAIYLKTSTILKYCQFAFIGLLAYYIPLFFFEDLIQIRQGFATGVAIYSVRFIVDRQFWRFLICIILGSFFHGSIIVFIPAYWLARLNLTSAQMILLVFLSLGLSQIKIITTFRPILELVIPLDSVQRGLAYTETGYSSAASYGLAELVKLILAAVMIYYKNIALKFNPSFKPFLNLFFVGIVAYFALRADGIFAIRLTGYYSSFVYLTIPMLIYSIRNRVLEMRLLYFVFTAYLIALLFRFIELNGIFFSDYYNIFYNLNTNPV